MSLSLKTGGDRIRAVACGMQRHGNGVAYTVPFPRRLASLVFPRPPHVPSRPHPPEALNLAPRRIRYAPARLPATALI